MNNTQALPSLTAYFSVWGLGVVGGAELLDLPARAKECPLRESVRRLRAQFKAVSSRGRRPE